MTKDKIGCCLEKICNTGYSCFDVNLVYYDCGDTFTYYRDFSPTICYAENTCPDGPSDCNAFGMSSFGIWCIIICTLVCMVLCFGCVFNIKRKISQQDEAARRNFAEQ